MAAVGEGEVDPEEKFSNGCCEEEGSLPDSAMETGSEGFEEEEFESKMRQSSSLQLMLSSIAQQRERDGPRHKLVSDGESPRWSPAGHLATICWTRPSTGSMYGWINQLIQLPKLRLDDIKESLNFLSYATRVGGEHNQLMFCPVNVCPSVCWLGSHFYPRLSVPNSNSNSLPLITMTGLWGVILQGPVSLTIFPSQFKFDGNFI